MSDPDVEREDEANEERAGHRDDDQDGGILDTVERAFRGIVRVENDESSDPADRERRRQATDAEERP